MNDEKRHKTREIRIYKSLIIATGLTAVILFILSAPAEGLIRILLWYLGPIAFVAFGASLLLSVWGFFTGSWLLRKQLLLWYACLAMLFLIEESAVSAKLADNILTLGVVVLFILPVIWVRNASRS